jgi:hypothetical protein
VDNEERMVVSTMVIEAHEFDQLLPYWKPEEGKLYDLVVFSDWEIKQGNFGPELSMKVRSADKELFKDKKLNTKNATFLKQIWPMIDASQCKGYEIIAVSLSYKNKKYELQDRTDEIMANVIRAKQQLFTAAPTVVPQ